MDAADFYETVEVHGKISSETGRTGPLAFRVTYPKYRPGPVQVHGIVTESGQHPLQFGLPSWGGKIEVWGQLPSGETVRLDNVSMRKVGQVEIDLWCSGFTFGTELRLEFGEGKYWIEVALPNASVADVPLLETSSYLGTIESKRSEEDGIKWHSPVGEAVLADFYHYEHPPGKGDLFTRVKETEIRIGGDITTNIEPPMLLAQIEREIEDPLQLLSFLSRRLLGWFEIRETFLPTPGSGFAPCTFLKRRHFKDRGVGERDPLLLQHHLVDGKFQKLVECLRASPIKDWLVRAMIYSSGSHEEGPIEDQLAAAYMALEALSLGLSQSRGREQILSEQESEKFSSWMTASIGQFCEKHDLDEDIKQQLGANVNNLGRVSFKRRVRALIEETNVSVKDLWPPGTHLSKGLQRVIERRNKFIHEARIESPPWPLIKDLKRVQAIVERSILALLDWDQTQLSPSAYRHHWLTEDD